MIKRLLFFVSASLLFTSCLKTPTSSCTFTESSVVAPASEVTALQTWVTANHPGAILHPSGFFFEITVPGTGTGAPGICSNVLVKYVGTLTNGTQFDANTTGTSFALGQLIVGWQKGIPLSKKGGTINLYIPPSLGYGPNQAGIIPPNSNLVFTIQLMDFQ
jgi:FKBP-type peptidyl-prolyl cis-trans isomerase FkpA